MGALPSDIALSGILYAQPLLKAWGRVTFGDIRSALVLMQLWVLDAQQDLCRTFL